VRQPRCAARPLGGRKFEAGHGDLKKETGVSKRINDGSLVTAMGRRSPGRPAGASAGRARWRSSTR